MQIINTREERDKYTSRGKWIIKFEVYRMNIGREKLLQIRRDLMEEVILNLGLTK